jgi:hypothetical protein
MVIGKNTNEKLAPSASALNMPRPLSYISISKITTCIIAGAERRRAGRAGSPSDIEDRERNTEVWYTSFDRNEGKSSHQKPAHISSITCHKG